MTQPSPPGGSQAQPGRGQPPDASGQPLTPGAQHLAPGAQHLTASGQHLTPRKKRAPRKKPAAAGAQPAAAGTQPAAAGGSGTGLAARLAWASVPVWSIGFLSFTPFLRLAIARRGMKDWAVFMVYIVAVVVEIALLSIAGQGSGGQNGAGAAAGGLVILLMGGGAVHTYAAFGKRPARAVASRPDTSEQLNREALATARGRMERRREAREIVSKNPILGRELRIGRPDLAREYDDGGLVDVNHVPGEILQSQLGLSPDEAAAVLAARGKLGSFSSANEVTTYAELPPNRLDAVRDWMIFG